MFDELFPRSASHFAPNALSSREWKNGTEDATLHFRWSMMLFADDLQRMCASHRSKSDRFSGHKFVQKLHLFHTEYAAMTKRTLPQQTRQDDRAEWKGFLDLRLDDETLTELDSWKPRPTEVWEEVDRAIREGYRFTLTYNSRTKMTSCTMIDDLSSRKTGGYALSSSDTDGALALKMAIFKHVKLGRVWDELIGRSLAPGKIGRAHV